MAISATEIISTEIFIDAPTYVVLRYLVATCADLVHIRINKRHACTDHRPFMLHVLSGGLEGPRLRRASSFLLLSSTSFENTMEWSDICSVHKYSGKFII